jgi:hypothetical protein
MMYRRLSQLSATLMVALGVAMLAVTAWHGGGSTGLLIGTMFVAAGAGRIWLLRKKDR